MSSPHRPQEIISGGQTRNAWQYSQFDAGIAVCLIVLTVILRLALDIPNFAPIGAVAIFGGAVLPRRLAFAVPLAAIILSDLVIGLHDLILVTWGSYALIALVSHAYLRKLTFARGLRLTLGASLFFFVVTNLAVWITSAMYPHTLAGLVECFALALPFFRNTLLSDLFYVVSLFGLYGLAIRVEAKVPHVQRTY